MNTRLILTCSLAIGVFLASSTALSLDPEVCDPKEDPAECQCSTADYETCEQVTYSSLLDPNEPELVRKATNLTAKWNSTEELYEVTLDVRGLKHGAVVPLLSNRGNWSSVDAYDAYMEKLLGIDIPGPDCSADYTLPPMRIRQKGTSVRFNQDTGKFIEPAETNLIYSIAMSADGQILFDGNVVFDREAPGPDPTCIGKDDTATANNGTPMPTDTGSSVADFSVYQCSETTESERVEYEGIGGCQPAQVVRIPQYWAGTTVESTYFQTWERQVSCEGNFNAPNGDLVCDFTESDFAFVWRRRNPDSIDIDNTYFSSSGTADPQDTPAITDGTSEVVESEGGDNSGPRGVCGIGDSKRGSNAVTTETRDGAYTWGHPNCSY